MSEHTIKATSRAVEGKGASRRLRHAASIPAIVYGGKSAPQPIQLEHEPIWLAQQNEWFYSSILTLEVDGKSEQVLLRDMQRHPFKQIIMHLDFQRVSANQAVRVSVPLHFINEAESPAVKLEKCTINHVVAELDIECLAEQLPEFLTVDLKGMTKGKSLHVDDLVLDPSIKVRTHGRKNPVIATPVEIVEEVIVVAAAPAADKGKKGKGKK